MADSKRKTARRRERSSCSLARRRQHSAFGISSLGTPLRAVFCSKTLPKERRKDDGGRTEMQGRDDDTSPEGTVRTGVQVMKALLEEGRRCSWRKDNNERRSIGMIVSKKLGRHSQKNDEGWTEILPMEWQRKNGDTPEGMMKEGSCRNRRATTLLLIPRPFPADFPPSAYVCLLISSVSTTVQFSQFTRPVNPPRPFSSAKNDLVFQESREVDPNVDYNIKQKE
ncbi:uncharacterized protein LOC143370995 [Andrena cerasifolii]|uniref:uncharacterized protein LOC143370995 n=1 Tax=Andrena cerasifolii TaxID=2819439 RepID=UPI0040376770